MTDGLIDSLFEQPEDRQAECVCHNGFAEKAAVLSLSFSFPKKALM